MAEQNVIRTQKQVMGWTSTMEVAEVLTPEEHTDALFDRDCLSHPRPSMEDAVAAAAKIARRWGQRFRNVQTVHEVIDVDGSTLSRTYP